MIKITNLSKSYGTNKVLNGINVTFEPGRVYGIVGVNGAGKSTLFRCISGLEDYMGKIEISGKHLHEETAFLSTNPFFLDRLTGREYLQFICHAQNIEPADFDKRNIFQLPLDDYATQYSTGMKKKLALSGVLIQKKNCFILDEPFNGVDIQSNLVISGIISKLKETGKTILLSSHIFSALSELCDTILLLENGRFSRIVNKHEFNSLEQEMKSTILGNDIDLLELE
jgi:ABC-2 type transport system ATP-binding protein